jgi:hypothetical protein
VSDVEKVIGFFKRMLQVRCRTPCIYVICIGGSVREEHLPAPLSRFVGENFGVGMYMRKYQAALVRCTDRKPVLNTVAHELAHASMSVLTGGYSFGHAVEEGFAGYAEYCLMRGEKVALPEHCSRQRFWKPEDLLTVRELLPDCAWKKDNPQDRRKRAYLSYWLNAYLLRISRQRRDVKALLRTLWEKRMRHHEDVYSLLLETSAMSADVFENGFACYCTTGQCSITED